MSANNGIFVIKEVGHVPSGVVTVLKEKLVLWPAGSKFFLCCNKDFWAQDIFKDLSLNYDNNLQIIRFTLFSESGFYKTSIKLKLYYIPYFIKAMKFLYSFLLFLEFLFCVKKISPDFIISHNGGWPGGELNRIAVLAAFVLRIPRRVLVVHNLPWKCPTIFQGIYKIYGKIFSFSATDVVSVSHACKSVLCKSAGVKVSKVIYNGTPLVAPRKSTFFMSHYPSIDQLPVVGFVGEIHPRKGLDTLVMAMDYIPDKFRIMFVGSGDWCYQSHLENILKSKGVSYEFCGYQNNLEDFWEKIDVLVLPSTAFESFGLVLIEAMVRSIPVVCSDFNGMVEVNMHGETGFVFPAGDAGALSKALCMILTNEPLYHRLASGARQRVLNYFSIQTMTKNYYNLCVKSNEV